MFLTGSGFVKSDTATSERALFRGEFGIFVGNIVDDAHESVESSETIALGLREKIKGVVEIAASGAREAMAGGVGITNFAIGRRRPGRCRRQALRNCVLVLLIKPPRLG